MQDSQLYPSDLTDQQVTVLEPHLPPPATRGRKRTAWRAVLNAIFAAIKPAEFEKCLLSWITALHEISDGQIVAIDGKALSTASAGTRVPIDPGQHTIEAHAPGRTAWSPPSPASPPATCRHS